jgi:hypothetical protein
MPGGGASAYTVQRCLNATDPTQPPAILLGPWLGDLAQTAAERRPGYSALQYLYESLTEPDAFLAPDCPVVGACPGGLMPYYSQLSDQELADLLAYLLSLNH